MIALTEDESNSLQRLYLQGEGVSFNEKGVVDLKQFQFEPECAD